MAVQKVLVSSFIAPLYKEARPDSELADEALYGMEADVLQDGDYVHVRMPYRYEGFAPRGDLSFDEKLLARYRSLPQVFARKPAVDIKAGPAMVYPILATLPQGGRAALLDGKPVPTEKPHTGPLWYRVLTAGGEEGYVSSGCVSPLPESFSSLSAPPAGEEQFRENLVCAARSYLGVQYRWGGKTHLGIDCSGLVSMAYMLNGLYIYRDASLQSGFPMHEISRDNIKKGDALYYKGHIALYLGEGKIIHSTDAAGSEGVCIRTVLPDILAVGSVFP